MKLSIKEVNKEAIKYFLKNERVKELQEIFLKQIPLEDEWNSMIIFYNKQHEEANT